MAPKEANKTSQHYKHKTYIRGDFKLDFMSWKRRRTRIYTWHPLKSLKNKRESNNNNNNNKQHKIHEKYLRRRKKEEKKKK